MKRVVILLALLVGCGKNEPPAAVDAGHNAFKYRNFILSQTFGGGRTLDGSIDIDAARDSGGSSDWIEVAINGDVLGRMPGGNRVSQQVKFRPGPNKVTFFISAAVRYWEFDVSARQNTRVEFSPKDKGEWTVAQFYDE